MGVPFREYLTVNRGALSEENEFSVIVQFGAEQPTSPFLKPGQSVPQIRSLNPGTLPVINTRSRQNI